jgi:hypothetical protein
VSPQTRLEDSLNGKARSGSGSAVVGLTAETSTPPKTASNGSPAVRSRPASISAVAWTPIKDMELHEWMLEGRYIGGMLKGSPWWIGDWLLYGATKWGERYVEAAKVTGYDAKSLRNMRYVSSRFDLSLRKDNLTYSHHALLAGYDPDQQAYWLDRASADRFSVDDLRLELRSSHRDSKPAAVEEEHTGAVPVGAKGLVCPHCGGDVPFPQDVSLQKPELAAA